MNLFNSHYFTNPKLAASQLFTIAGLMLLCPKSFAQDTLSIDPVASNLEYGVIASENGICRMNDRGSLLGLAGQSCLGNGSPAQFSINGDPGLVIFVTAAGSTDNQGVEFAPSIAGSATKVISPSGATSLSIVGDLILNNAGDGAHSLDYLVNVHYE